VSLGAGSPRLPDILEIFGLTRPPVNPARVGRGGRLSDSAFQQDSI